jgi:hypothetical protein
MFVKCFHVFISTEIFHPIITYYYRWRYMYEYVFTVIRKLIEAAF